MDYKNYVDSVAKAFEHPRNTLRLGQTYFNLLFKWRPDLADKVLSAGLDPFYNDEQIPKFLEFVKRNWSGEHNLTIEERPYFSSGTVYIAHCSCGQYTSGKATRKLDAEKMWLNHMVAKTQNS
jgi:hypothetical protein